MDLAKLTISELRNQYESGDAGPKDAIAAIEKAVASRDSEVGGYLSLDFEAALNEAENADLSKPLGGVPIAIKDLINVRGQPCGCASKMLTGAYQSPYDATVIQKLREAGAIPLGRTNMDEFAMGSSTENSGIQPTRNPWDLERAPGGSSGGSAAVVAANTAIASLGSDTGGSIRQPASFCGCVGLKPSYGRVSRYGLVAFASSLDQIGPMTKTVKDSALLLEAIAGHDERDSTCLKEDVPDYLSELKGDLNGLKIGMPKEYFGEGIDGEVRTQVEAAIRQLESLGGEIVEVSLPNSEPAIAVYYIIATAEASANLARFDGVRYGHRTENVEDLRTHYQRSRAEGFGDEVKRRIILGTYVLSSGYTDQYYSRAQKVRTLIRQDFENALEKVDVLVSPTSPTPAFKIGEKTNDPLQMYLADIFTIAANLAGICGISLPCGMVDGLPVGLQLLGKAFDESSILRVAHAYEQNSEWHKNWPSLD
ncbi:MAG: Asp-tRNA(Asn)/Glu-tRNA(Gln) amidotransferase subunit GatA [Verrucomicrobiota bacterium]